MSKRSERPVTRRHIHIYDEDWEFLTARCGPHTEHKLTVSEFIRNIVNVYTKHMRAKEQAALDEARSGAPGAGIPAAIADDGV